MRAALIAAPLVAIVTSCTIDLDHRSFNDANNTVCVTSVSPACAEAPNHNDLTWLQANVFTNQCSNFSGCHNGIGSVQASQHPDLRDGFTFAALVGHPADLDSGRMLVVPRDPASSYLMVMIGGIPPKDATPPTSLPKVGLMPQASGALVCCQKLDAIQRWIMDGAKNN